jgi:hypothetical protein
MPAVFSIFDPRPHPLDMDETGTSGSSRNKSLLGRDRLADAVFLVGPDDRTAVRIPVHTFLLMAAGEAFEKMFSGNWKKEEAIRIIDCNESAMYSLLRWIYTDRLVIEADRLTDVMHVAKKYFVNGLFNFIAVNLQDNDSFVWEVISFSAEFDHKKITNKCLDIIKADPDKYLKQPESLSSCGDAVAAIVSSDIPVTEMCIFKWALKWAEEECKREGIDPQMGKRQVMQPFIRQFAFASMDQKEFADFVSASGVLSGDEQLLIFRIMSGIQLENPFRKNARQLAIKCTSWPSGSLVLMLSCRTCGHKVCRECYNKVNGCYCCDKPSLVCYPNPRKPQHITPADLCTGAKKKEQS